MNSLSAYFGEHQERNHGNITAMRHNLQRTFSHQKQNPYSLLLKSGVFLPFKTVTRKFAEHSSCSMSQFCSQKHFVNKFDPSSKFEIRVVWYSFSLRVHRYRVLWILLLRAEFWNVKTVALRETLLQFKKKMKNRHRHFQTVRVTQLLFSRKQIVNNSTGL